MREPSTIATVPGTQAEAPALDAAQLVVADGEPRAVPGERLERVTDLVGKGRYVEAAQAAGRLWSEGFHDARLVGIHLYGVFEQGGFSALPAILERVRALCTDGMAGLAPAARRAEFLDSALRWLWKSLARSLEHHAQLGDATWRAWCDAPGAAAAYERVRAAAGPLDAAQAAALGERGAQSAWRRLLAWIDANAASFAPPPAASVDEPAGGDAGDEMDGEENDGDDGGDDDDDDDNDTAVPDRPAAPVAATAAAEGGVTVTGSPALALLLRKLAAFEALIAREDYLKAAIVAADIEETVERFDPRVFFPSLFAGYFRVFSEHVEEIEPHIAGGGEALAWKALAQLYRVDLDAFLRP